MILSLFMLLIDLGSLTQYQHPNEKYTGLYEKYENFKSPIKSAHIQKVVFFSGNRKNIHNRPFLRKANFQGGQIAASLKKVKAAKNHHNSPIIKKGPSYQNPSYQNPSYQNPSEKYANAYKKYENSKSPIKNIHIKNFVYFSRAREDIHNHPFLKNANFQGAQIMYSWKELEPSKDHYNFSIIKEDLDYLNSKGKKLFIQLQDTTFTIKYKGIPEYLTTSEYDGGRIYQRDDDGKPEGWAAKRWNLAVRGRFKKLLMALGKEFDGKVEGINLQETAIGVSHKYDASFTPKGYVKAIKANMLNLKEAFPKSVTMQYANFMPGEWLPWDDKGYLKSIYKYGEKIHVGIGGPDLMVTKKGQLNHTITMMHEHQYTMPLGIAIQDGNYIGQTGNTVVKNKRKNLVPMLYNFAEDFLKVDYIFWANQKPYFKEDVLKSFD